MPAIRWRLVRQEEQKARGCPYCADATKGAWWCPYEFCPYYELDNYAKYQDYMKANGATVPQIIRRLKA